MKMKKIALLAVFLLIYLVAIPLVFRDRPYFLRVLTTASVLSVISAGVWLIFYIGRINIGQGAGRINLHRCAVNSARIFQTAKFCH